MNLVEQHWIEELINLTCMIQQIPSPTFNEARRGEFVRLEFIQSGLAQVHADSSGNIWGLLPGLAARPLTITAHLDTVFPLETPLTLQRLGTKIQAPGIGDNSLGVAGLVMLAKYLKSLEVPLPTDLWLVANVREEGLGNLDGMRAVAEQFKGQPGMYIVVEGMGLGDIVHRGLGVKRYRWLVETGGGHSWIDYGSPSAIHLLAQAAAKLSTIRLPEKPRTTFNIGTIQGGTSINTIAAHAAMLLDLRSEDPTSLAHLDNQVRAVAEAVHVKGVKVILEEIGLRPAGEMAIEHPLVQMSANVLRGLGLVPGFDIASTDANIPLSLGQPAVCIGLTVGDGAHTTQETIDLNALPQGFTQLVRLVQQASELHSRL